MGLLSAASLRREFASMQGHRILRFFLLQSAAWTLLCISVETYCRFALHLGLPYDYPGIVSWTTFIDFHSFISKFAFFHSRLFFSRGETLPYPAPALVAYKLFLTPQPAGGRVAVPIYEFTILVISWIMLFLFRRALVRRGLAPRTATGFVLGTYFLSFPFWFEWLQGNIEFAVWALLFLGIAAFWNDKLYLAAVCLGVAAAMKVFPLVFLGLFLARRETPSQYRALYRALAVAMLSASVSTVVSVWLVCPDFAYSWQQINLALFHFQHEYMLNLLQVQSGFDHSLFALIKRAMLPLLQPAQVENLLRLYLPAVAFAGCMAFFLRIRRLPFANQVACLTIAAVLLPPVSYDYTLIHLYAPFALLVFVALDHARTRQPPPGLFAALCMLAFLLAAQSEFILHGVRFAGQLKSLALLMLGYLCLRYPFAAQPQPPATAPRIATSSTSMAANVG